MAEGFLRNGFVVDLDIALDGLGQRLGGVAAGGGQDLGKAPGEALDQDVGLWGARLDEAMFNRVGGTDSIEAMASGRFAFTGGTEAIGELLTVLGQDAGDGEGGLGDQALQEAGGVLSGMLGPDRDVEL